MVGERLDNAALADEPIFGGSLRYGFSNKNAMVIAGAAGLLFIVVLWGGIIAALYTRNNLAIWAVLGLVLVLALPALILINGYTVRCARCILQGQLTAPDILYEVRELILDGVKALPVYIEGLLYGVVLIVIYYLLVYLFALVVGRGNASVAACLLYVLLIIASMAAGVVNQLQMVVLAETGSVLKGANPLMPLMLCLRDPVSFALAFLSSLFVRVTYAIPMVILVILVCTSILIPFLFLPLLASQIYVFTRYYRRMAGGGPGAGTAVDVAGGR